MVMLHHPNVVESQQEFDDTADPSPAHAQNVQRRERRLDDTALGDIDRDHALGEKECIATQIDGIWIAVNLVDQDRTLHHVATTDRFEEMRFPQAALDGAELLGRVKQSNVVNDPDYSFGALRNRIHPHCFPNEGAGLSDTRSYICIQSWNTAYESVKETRPERVFDTERNSRERGPCGSSRWPW